MGQPASILATPARASVRESKAHIAASPIFVGHSGVEALAVFGFLDVVASSARAVDIAQASVRRWWSWEQDQVASCPHTSHRGRLGPAACSIFARLLEPAAQATRDTCFGLHFGGALQSEGREPRDIPRAERAHARGGIRALCKIPIYLDYLDFLQTLLTA
jgi:hypothetical protein